jgi:hypothetical protein
MKSSATTGTVRWIRPSKTWFDGLRTVPPLPSGYGRSRRWGLGRL